MTCSNIGVTDMTFEYTWWPVIPMGVYLGPVKVDMRVLVSVFVIPWTITEEPAELEGVGFTMRDEGGASTGSGDGYDHIGA